MPTIILAATLTCSSFSGVTTCNGRDNYHSRETEFNGVTNGEDNKGNTWRKVDSWSGQTITIKRHKAK